MQKATKIMYQSPRCVSLLSSNAAVEKYGRAITIKPFVANDSKLPALQGGTQKSVLPDSMLKEHPLSPKLERRESPMVSTTKRCQSVQFGVQQA
jgi:hypothetical protein